MYAYRIGHAPFNPESRTLDINIHLKIRGAACSAPYTRAEGYKQSPDNRLDVEIRRRELRQLGIRWMAEEAIKFVEESVLSRLYVRH